MHTKELELPNEGTYSIFKWIRNGHTVATNIMSFFCLTLHIFFFSFIHLLSGKHPASAVSRHVLDAQKGVQHLLTFIFTAGRGNIHSYLNMFRDSINSEADLDSQDKYPKCGRSSDQQHTDHISHPLALGPETEFKTTSAH